MSELPVGWTKEPLAKLGTWTGGGTPSTTNADFWTNGTIPWVSPKDMKQRRITTAQDSITEAAVRASATNLIPENSVMLVTRSGILRHSLPVATNTQPVTLNQDMKALTPLDALLTDYLYFVFRRYEREILHGCCKGGTTVQSVEASRLMAFEIPVPPLPEQRRIVEKIEELFSELDAGVANLKKARAQLAVYRQALLKHAFEGKLTAKWRTEHAAELESAGQLLARIRVARDSDFNPITEQETEILPVLPINWTHARFGEFVQSMSAGKSFSCDERRPHPDEVGVAKVSAVTWGEYLEEESKTCVDPAKINASYFIQEGDFLLSRANTIDLVGASVIVKRVTQRIMLSDKTLRLSIEGLPQEYLLYYLRSRQGRREIMSRSTGNQESMRNIGQDRIRSIIVPVCSPMEAAKIVELIEAHLSPITALEADIDLNLQKAEALRQSILKKAFAGELVPQDPADEPAAALLARIRAERGAQAAAAAVAKTGKARKIKVP
jgi:type I restriction enzyme S subunit